MTKYSALLKATAALAALTFSAQGWAVPGLSVESRTVAPEEAFTINVNLTEGNTVAGANLRLQGQGSGLSSLSAGAGSISSGHTTDTNVLSNLNDFRAVIFNPTTTTNFTGDGVLHTLSGRVSSTAADGQVISFDFDESQSALSDAAGNAIAGATFTTGNLTVDTPFPYDQGFPTADGNGWTFFDGGAGLPPFNFGDMTEGTPGGSLTMGAHGKRSDGTWTGPTTITPNYSDNLVVHTFNVSTNKTAPSQLLSDMQVRGADDYFHQVFSTVVNPGAGSPLQTAKNFVLVTERDGDPLSPTNITPVFEVSRFFFQAAEPATNDTVYTLDNYSARRYSTTAVLNASTTEVASFDLTASGSYFNFGGGNLAIYPIFENPPSGTPEQVPDEYFQSPTFFTTDGANPVWGYEKDAVQANQVRLIGVQTKNLDGGGAPVTQAGEMYIAEFTVNTDIAQAILGPTFRCRVNLFGNPPGGNAGDPSDDFNQASITIVNSVVKEVTPGVFTTLAKYPTPGNPEVIRVYVQPAPGNDVGANFQFSFDMVDINSGALANNATGRVWVSNIALKSVNLGTVSPIE